MDTTKNTSRENTSPDKHLLVIDDDPLFCDVVSCAGIENIIVHTANTASSGLALCNQYKMDVVLLDQQLPDKNGSDICPAILARNDRTKIIFATAYPDIHKAVAVIKSGAFDYLAKPFNIDELTFAIDRAVKASELEQVAEISSWKHRQEEEQAHFIGSSQPAQAVRNAALLAARSKAPTLLTGATGTGKTLLAQFIHYQSPLRDKVFLSINCAVLPENLIEAELFGTEKGAFTDARATKRGIFEMASGGTLFLDEIATLPYHLQAKLLGVLDDGRIKRLGSETSRKIDVRIIAATNTNLLQAVHLGAFREDLFYRLSVLNIELPSLHQRKGDIPALCRHFLSPELSKALPSSELNALTHYPWPGNVRELKNILERASLLAEGEELTPSRFLNDPQQLSPQSTESSTDVLCEANSQAANCSLQEMERMHIERTLQALNHNKSQAAQSLNISRSTLLRKIKQYKLPSP